MTCRRHIAACCCPGALLYGPRHPRELWCVASKVGQLKKKPAYMRASGTKSEGDVSGIAEFVTARHRQRAVS